jgi:hypothetical protein
MMLKKSKEDILMDVQVRVGAKLNDLSNYRPNVYQDGSGFRVDFSGLNWAIQSAITNSTVEAISTLIDNQYTHDDFERDLQLK